MLDEFDEQQKETAEKLDAYEKERRQQERKEHDIDEESGHMERVDNDEVSTSLEKKSITHSPSPSLISHSASLLLCGVCVERQRAHVLDTLI